MKIRFTLDSQFGKYTDALTLPDDHSFSDEEIEAMKQQRLNNWLAVMTAPRPEPIVDENGNPVLDEDGNPTFAE